MGLWDFHLCFFILFNNNIDSESDSESVEFWTTCIQVGGLTKFHQLKSQPWATREMPR